MFRVTRGPTANIGADHVYSQRSLLEDFSIPLDKPRTILESPTTIAGSSMSSPQVRTPLERIFPSRGSPRMEAHPLSTLLSKRAKEKPSSSLRVSDSIRRLSSEQTAVSSVKTQVSSQKSIVVPASPTPVVHFDLDKFMRAYIDPDFSSSEIAPKPLSVGLPPLRRPVISENAPPPGNRQKAPTLPPPPDVLRNPLRTLPPLPAVNSPGLKKKPPNAPPRDFSLPPLPNTSQHSSPNSSRAFLDSLFEEPYQKKSTRLPVIAENRRAPPTLPHANSHIAHNESSFIALSECSSISMNTEARREQREAQWRERMYKGMSGMVAQQATAEERLLKFRVIAGAKENRLQHRVHIKGPLDMGIKKHSNLNSQLSSWMGGEI